MKMIPDSVFFGGLILLFAALAFAIHRVESKARKNHQPINIKVGQQWKHEATGRIFTIYDIRDGAVSVQWLDDWGHGGNIITTLRGWKHKIESLELKEIV
jgi:hypothetical protein